MTRNIRTNFIYNVPCKLQFKHNNHYYFPKSFIVTEDIKYERSGYVFNKLLFKTCWRTHKCDCWSHLAFLDWWSEPLLPLKPFLLRQARLSSCHPLHICSSSSLGNGKSGQDHPIWTWLVLSPVLLSMLQSAPSFCLQINHN